MPRPLSSPQTADDLLDLLIVGGGPAGATAALYSARSGRRTRVIDKGVSAGALGKSRDIANFPGILGPIPGTSVVERIREQAASFGAEFVVDRVTASSLGEPVKTAWGAKDAYRARALLVATGSMGRSVLLPGEEELVGRGVSYCATCDGFFFRDQEVAVAGDSEEAAEEALLLARYAAHVHVLVPAEALRAPRAVLDEIAAAPNVSIHPWTRVRAILGQAAVEAVEVKSLDGDARPLPVAGAFLYLQGGRPIVDWLGGQVPLTQQGCIVVDEFYQTPVPGVFAAGDVLCKHLKQAVIAAAEGASAAVSVDRYLSGRAALRPDWA
ncbi:MAG: FAD-dependent oxidoreductase [Candidatus Bipolaricaulota bacterium]